MSLADCTVFEVARERVGMSEEQSLIEAAKRDPKALAELYRIHYPAITGYVRKRVSDPNEADDIVSSVFLSMVKELYKYRCRGVPFRIWLFRLANTQLSRWARSRRRWASRELDEYNPENATADSTNNTDAEAIDLVLSTLPPRLQSVLTLHYLEGMKVADIALVVRCSPGTVKSRLSEARKLMRERLTKRGF